jgi:hypothetical protein
VTGGVARPAAPLTRVRACSPPASLPAQLSVGKLLAEAIVSIHTGKSVSQLFDVKNPAMLT